jgi:hypothetical protein
MEYRILNRCLKDIMLILPPIYNNIIAFTKCKGERLRNGICMVKLSVAEDMWLWWWTNYVCKTLVEWYWFWKITLLETYLYATLSTTDPTRTRLTRSPGLCGVRPVQEWPVIWIKAVQQWRCFLRHHPLYILLGTKVKYIKQVF